MWNQDFIIATGVNRYLPEKGARTQVVIVIPKPLNLEPGLKVKSVVRRYDIKCQVVEFKSDLV